MRIENQRLPWGVMLLVCFFSFFWMLGGHSLWDVDEPNNAVCAREMLLSGNYWVPVFNGDLRYDKPILLYWLMMPSYALFGFNEFAARLPSAIAATALVATVAGFASRLLSPRVGFFAALMLATSLHMVVIGRAATPDPLFIMFTGFAMFAFFTYLHEGARRTWLLYAAYASLGFGALAKGPAALLLPGLVVLTYLALSGGLSQWRLLRPLQGLAITLAVAMPWYAVVGWLTEGDWLQGFIWHHNVERFMSPLQGHRGFPGMYALTMTLGLFPWSGLFLAALVFGSWRLERLRSNPLRLFLLCWIGVYFVFFTLARTQLPSYMLPAFPAAAVLMSMELEQGGRRAVRWLVGGSSVLALLFIVGGGVILASQWEGAWLYLVALLPVLCVALWCRSAKAEKALLMQASAMVVSVFLLTSWALPSFDRYKIAPRLAEAAAAAGFEGSGLAAYRYFQPSLLFYHGGRIPILPDAQALKRWLEDGNAVVMPVSALSDLDEAERKRIRMHFRAFGLYARKEIVLLSLSSTEAE